MRYVEDSKYRINGGYSQERLAEAVDLSTSYISEIENGKKRPSMKTLEKSQRYLTSL